MLIRLGGQEASCSIAVAKPGCGGQPGNTRTDLRCAFGAQGLSKGQGLSVHGACQHTESVNAGLISKGEVSVPCHFLAQFTLKTEAQLSRSPDDRLVCVSERLTHHPAMQPVCQVP